MKIFFVDSKRGKTGYDTFILGGNIPGSGFLYFVGRYKADIIERPEISS